MMSTNPSGRKRLLEYFWGGYAEKNPGGIALLWINGASRKEKDREIIRRE
jgi:hypothetical protein